MSILNLTCHSRFNKVVALAILQHCVLLDYNCNRRLKIALTMTYKGKRDTNLLKQYYKRTLFVDFSNVGGFTCAYTPKIE